MYCVTSHGNLYILSSLALGHAVDVVAFWHVQKYGALHNGNIKLTSVVAVRLRGDGRTEVLAPNWGEWLPYAEASIVLGKNFANLRSILGNPKQENYLQMDNKAIMLFIQDVLMNHLDAPTVAVIPANWWRNSRETDKGIARWSQLSNKKLLASQHILDFKHVPSGEQYQRGDRRFNNLLAVIRLRKDSETPQYTVGTDTWDASQQMGDIVKLSGYVDCTVREPLHYFSAARLPETQKGQKAEDIKGNYKAMNNTYDYAYKHAQLVELLPFFVRQDLHSEDAYKALCRCVHFLRVSPAFSKGNILLPYPMHLAKTLLDDLLCIVDAES